MLQPKISIIVPVYNVENYIAKCIESIINQSYTNLEIIIINDGSNDKSGEICNYYSKKDNRIILIHKEHQGVALARNNALDIASGDYIGWVDSDDWIAPDMFDTLYKNAVTYDADISMCNFYYVRENGELSPYSNENEGIKILEGDYKIAHNIRLNNNVLWNRLYKRYLFNDIRCPEGKIFEDIFIVHKLVDNANKVVLTSDCKYYYLRRETGITLSSFSMDQMDIVEAYIERYNYISIKYPNLEKTSRKFIFTSLLWGMRKAYIDNRIEPHKEALCKLINKIRYYDFLDCRLSTEEMKFLKLLFTDINSYITEMNFSIALR
jgi:glycosyltransferase involved in cell wall biosynthesis